MPRAIEELRALALEAMKHATPADIHEIRRALEEVERTANEELTGEAEAAAAFEEDMRPVCNAVVMALRDGDVTAFKGLKGLLAVELERINQAPELAEALAKQMGQELLRGLNAKPEPPSSNYQFQISKQELLRWLNAKPEEVT